MLRAALTYRRERSPSSSDITTASLDSPDTLPPTREIWLSHDIMWGQANDAFAPLPEVRRREVLLPKVERSTR